MLLRCYGRRGRRLYPKAGVGNDVMVTVISARLSFFVCYVVGKGTDKRLYPPPPKKKKRSESNKTILVFKICICC